MKRILTVSSGKGGVGKTTFAINFALALSTAGPTVLVDLDTGTSSVRNSIDVPVPRDLYHFLKKDVSLLDCITPLSPELDPEGRFRDFGFIAGPKHLIDDVSNFGGAAKAKLIAAINRLPAKYVVLDMKAGLGPNVIDFLPYSNSGILVFTPHLPAATLAASDIVKAILFSPDSPVYRDLGPRYPGMVAEVDLEHRRFPGGPRAEPRGKRHPRSAARHGRVLSRVLRSQHVQRRSRIVRHGGGALRGQPCRERLREAERIVKPPRPDPRAAALPADPQRAVLDQLDSLRAMYADQRESGVKENFAYITQRALHLIEGMRTSEFGETKICRPDEILAHFFPDLAHR